MDKIEQIKQKFDIINSSLDERTRRLWCAAEAKVLGRGGIGIVSQATGVARSTISLGKQEIESSETTEKSKNGIRKIGGGRKTLESKDKSLLAALNALVEPETRGDPESPLRWTTKSTRNLATALNNSGISISHEKARTLLISNGYSLQALRKTNEGKSHVDRDKQFSYINDQTKEFQSRGCPVVSVDAKKKELIGRFKNDGQEYQPTKSPEEVNVYDFRSLAEGRATPYGVYDITNNDGWVSVGVSKDTAMFAVATLRSWWFEMGNAAYPNAKKLLIHADSGGSNGRRNRLWKSELQKFSNEIGVEITVSHFPPGTSKWNKIEHRLFSQITKNWRGRPLESFEVVVNLIGATSTAKGLSVRSILDTKEYEGGIKVSEEDFKAINIYKHDFHGDDWNYSILPQSPIGR